MTAAVHSRYRSIEGTPLNFTNVILGIALYILIWESLPEWGGWFNAILKKMPVPFQSLYEMWRCAYCVGFWMGLGLHATTGIWTLPALAELPAYWGHAAPVISWFLDALATATLIYVGKLIIDVIYNKANV